MTSKMTTTRLVPWIRCLVLASAASASVSAATLKNLRRDGGAGSSADRQRRSTAVRLSSGVSEGLQVEVSTATGATTVRVDGEPWLSAGGSALSVRGWPDLAVVASRVSEGSDPTGGRGRFRSLTLLWGVSSTSDTPGDVEESRLSDGSMTVETSIVAYRERELVVFEQYWPKGWKAASPLSPFGESSGRWMRDGAKSDNGTVLAGFPSIHTTSPSPGNDDTQSLKFLTWGDCQIGQGHSGAWDGTQGHLFDGATSGEPLVLHERSNETGQSASGTKNKVRTLVLSPMGNFFVSGQASTDDGKSIECGILKTVRSLPAGFTHSTVLVGGRGINSTMMEWGDVLLEMGGKTRTDPYRDFVLSHLGYWTDNGAYYYHIHTNYTNSEEALKSVKEDFAARSIPVRYYQWDDWWMESRGDKPGILSWNTKTDEFPSGFTDWLGMPLALYAPMYSSENDWIGQYRFKKDPNGANTSIPLDPNFYRDLFRNGTSIGMKMFEQDFLCSYGIGGTGLTNTDVDTGRLWMQQMDAAAIETGTTVQFCMMDPPHALHSTLVKSMTNGRGGGDNTRNYDSLSSMGQNGLLFHSLGFFPSRDNVWTTAPDVEQPSCGPGRLCREPNAHADNAVAVLAGGPYGIADAVGFANRTLVMYSCRDDGVMLRPRWPLSSLDFIFTDDDAEGTLVWAAHDEFGPYRWSNVISINLDRDVSISTERLQGPSPGPMVGWKVEVGVPVETVVPFSDDHHGPLKLPREPPVAGGPSLSHWAAAPILPNGMALLGETSKWATMSARRVAKFEADAESVSALILGAPGEHAVFAYVSAAVTLSPTAKVSNVECDFGKSNDCARTDNYGNTDCVMILTCVQGHCSCGPNSSKLDYGSEIRNGYPKKIE